MRQNPRVAELDFDRFPLSEIALAGQGLERLTSEERTAIEIYAFNGYREINRALWDRTPLPRELAQRVDAIRSGLSKYPLQKMVRVTREAEAGTYGIVDAESAQREDE